MAPQVDNGATGDYRRFKLLTMAMAMTMALLPEESLCRWGCRCGEAACGSVLLIETG